MWLVDGHRPVLVYLPGGGTHIEKQIGSRDTVLETDLSFSELSQIVTHFHKEGAQVNVYLVLLPGHLSTSWAGDAARPVVRSANGNFRLSSARKLWRNAQSQRARGARFAGNKARVDPHALHVLRRCRLHRFVPASQFLPSCRQPA